MESAEDRKKHAKKASDASGKKRTQKGRPFAVGVVAAYLFLRFGKPKKSGHRFLMECDWCPEFDFEIGCDHTAAINTLAILTGKTKSHVRQTIRKHWNGKESHLIQAIAEQAKKPVQLNLLKTLA